MAKFILNANIEDMYNNLSKASERALEKALYSGAGEVIDTVRSEIEALTSDNKKGGARKYITPLQKQGLLDSLGLASVINDGEVMHTKVGFDGYNKVKTKTYPKGQPNALIARSVDSGATYMIKQPFMRRAIRKSKDRAIEKMKHTFDDELRKEL